MNVLGRDNPDLRVINVYEDLAGEEEGAPGRPPWGLWINSGAGHPVMRLGKPPERVGMRQSRAQTQANVSARRRTATVTPGTIREVEKPADEFDSWADDLKKKSAGCSACADTAVAQTIVALLDSMTRKRAFKITVHEIRRMVLKKHPESGVGQRGLERHLLSCVRGLYDRARGRFNG